MEPLADAGGFLLLRANLARSLERGIPCRDGLHAATRWTKTEPCTLPFTESSRRNFLLFQKVSEETLAAIHAAGYDYQGGAVIPRPGKDETDMAEQETKFRRWKNSWPVLPIFSH